MNGQLKKNGGIGKNNSTSNVYLPPFVYRLSGKQIFSQVVEVNAIKSGWSEIPYRCLLILCEKHTPNTLTDVVQKPHWETNIHIFGQENRPSPKWLKIAIENFKAQFSLSTKQKI